MKASTCSSMGAAFSALIPAPRPPLAARGLRVPVALLAIAPSCAEVARLARYCITILALSVFPAPDSPLTRIACRCSSHHHGTVCLDTAIHKGFINASNKRNTAAACIDQLDVCLLICHAADLTVSIDCLLLLIHASWHCTSACIIETFHINGAKQM